MIPLWLLVGQLELPRSDLRQVVGDQGLGIGFTGVPFGSETQPAIDIGITALADDVLLEHGHRVQQGQQSGIGLGWSISRGYVGS